MKKRYTSIILDYGIVVILLFLIVFFSFTANFFFSLSTFMTILRQVSITGIISIGMAFVIITGGIDLSVGSIAGVSAVTAALLMRSELPIFFACLITILIALGYGFINGLLITKIKMPPLIATLGMMMSLRGIAFIITDGLPVFGFNKMYSNFAKGNFLGIPYMILLLIFVFLLTLFVLNKTTFGRYVYGIGGNEEATRLSGINTHKIMIIVYSINGFLSGIAGLVLLSRTNSGQPSAGNGYEMDAITAVVLGGVSLTGGEGKLPLVMVGVLIMGILSTGMLMCNINDYVQQLVKGLVLLGAVTFSNESHVIRQKISNKLKT
ncbi:ABC transporter permease [Treponema parvum]|uniref:ABC transporter permease n=1 Tax=Treponema parvum TaxID=138851 RepID=A0A975F5I2_9SPIR|nr:ABC transporter permease [Treponema parvum]QTQ14842.1 ABC transporter permease [Treponema parvum]